MRYYVAVCLAIAASLIGLLYVTNSPSIALADEVVYTKTWQGTGAMDPAVVHYDTPANNNWGLRQFRVHLTATPSNTSALTVRAIASDAILFTGPSATTGMAGVHDLTVEGPWEGAKGGGVSFEYANVESIPWVLEASFSIFKTN